MKLIANALNGNYITNILPSDEHDVDCVMAAIAYGDDRLSGADSLLGNCISNGFKMDIWMRYDHTVPVSVNLLKKLLKSHSKNIYCRLIPDCLHSKLIWWKGYGAYIGSANLTMRAWRTNIETGIFLTEEDIINNSMDVEFEDFFDNLRNIKQSFPLRQEIIDEMIQLKKLRAGDDNKGKDKRSNPVWGGPADFNKKNAVDRKKESFKKEWHDTLTTLREIGKQLNNYRPIWVNEDIPEGWHADQFLHAYYYNQVADGLRKPFNEFYERNKSNPQFALKQAMQWWQSNKAPPSNEDITFYTNAPYIQNALKRDNISNLTEENFKEVCSYTHATVDHIIKISLSILGRNDISSMSRAERIPLYAKWLWTTKNPKGWNIKQLLDYVLHGGSDVDMWERIYNCGKINEYKIPHYGLNSIAEIAGWVKPDFAPPRNGRTSKALRALGFDVDIL